MLVSFFKNFFQKSYENIPKIGESHLNLMNTLDFPIAVKVTQAGSNQTFELDSSNNHVMYNLLAGHEYCLNVEILNKSNLENDEVGLCFNATSKHVN